MHPLKFFSQSLEAIFSQVIRNTDFTCFVFNGRWYTKFSTRTLIIRNPWTCASVRLLKIRCSAMEKSNCHSGEVLLGCDFGINVHPVLIIEFIRDWDGKSNPVLLSFQRLLNGYVKHYTPIPNISYRFNDFIFNRKSLVTLNARWYMSEPNWLMSSPDLGKQGKTCLSLHYPGWVLQHSTYNCPGISWWVNLTFREIASFSDFITTTQRFPDLFFSLTTRVRVISRSVTKLSWVWYPKIWYHTFSVQKIGPLISSSLQNMLYGNKCFMMNAKWYKGIPERGST